jgi:ATP-dependent protease HslVU (ClpYQ) peptidase subunit
MTVIVAGRRHGGGTFVACDSLTTTGWSKEQHADTKLWIAADQYVIGAAGCLRTAQVIRHYTDWPKFRPREDTDVETFLVKRLVPAIRTATNDHGVKRTDDGKERLDTSLLIAWGKHLAVVYGNGAAVIERRGRMAIGSGADHAIGALGDRAPWRRWEVIDAARVAAANDIGCDEPIYIANTIDLTIEAA